MKRAWRRDFLNLILVTLFGLPLVTPLMQWQRVPCTHDGHLHYHRVAAIRHAWENGVYFSRWLPDLAFGYGYPFFLYREPLPLYLTHFLHLAGLPLPYEVRQPPELRAALRSLGRRLVREHR